MTIKRLTWQIIFPLTIIAFGTVTKWWYVLPLPQGDAPDTMMTGFPLAFASDGWGSSGSLQIFLTELLVDFAIYFLFWFALALLLKRYLKIEGISKLAPRILWSLSSAVLICIIFIGSIADILLKKNRDWDRQILATGFKFTWTNKVKPSLVENDWEKK